MNWFKKKKKEIARKRIKIGWIVPWAIGKHLGKYYLLFSDYQQEEYGGTAIVFIEQGNSVIKVSMHPDEASQIRKIGEVRDEYHEVNLFIDKTMPNQEQVALEQSIATIDFVGRYSKDLANHLQDNLLERMKAKRQSAQK